MPKKLSLDVKDKLWNEVRKYKIDYGLKNNYLIYKDKWNTVRQFDVDFSYPKEVAEEKQEGLY